MGERGQTRRSPARGREQLVKEGYQKPNHDHAWRGAWDRPMKIDEDGLDPFTIARMTDHNVHGVDPDPGWCEYADENG